MCPENGSTDLEFQAIRHRIHICCVLHSRSIVQTLERSIDRALERYQWRTQRLIVYQTSSRQEKSSVVTGKPLDTALD